MGLRTRCPQEIGERTSFVYSTTLTKEDGTTLVSSDLSSLTLTLYALDPALTIINTINNMNILNANLGTIDGLGRLTVTLRPADTVILVDENLAEERIMLIHGTYAAGAKDTKHEVLLRIRNFGKIA